MNRCHLVSRLLVTGIVGAFVVSTVMRSTETTLRAVNDTIWVANRGAHTIRGFDAATGDVSARSIRARDTRSGV